MSVAIALLAPSVAAAQPRVDLDRCVLDAGSLRKAIDAELATIKPERVAAIGDRAIVVECPDAVTAHLRLEPGFDGPLARSVDLGEVPGELRLRLVALAVVELTEAAALIAIATPPTTEPEPDPDPPSTTPRTTPADPAPLREPTPPAFVEPVRDEPPVAHVTARRALGEPSRPKLMVSPRLGIRIYASQPVPMIDAATDVVIGPFAVGAGIAAGQTDDTLGTVRPILVTAIAGVTLACWRSNALELCASTRGRAGAAIAASSSSMTGVVADTATVPYVELAGQIELAWQRRRTSMIAFAEGGWSRGLIAYADNRDVVHLDGALLTTGVGVRW
jgi:hypothetical protein